MRPAGGASACVAARVLAGLALASLAGLAAVSAAAAPASAAAGAAAATASAGAGTGPTQQVGAPGARMPAGLQEVSAVSSLGECINLASQFHQVNPWVLTAILRHESGLRPGAQARNSNGSVDLGIGQINSVHWPHLARYGIQPQDLLNPCVGTFLAAWHLGEQIRRFGNTWFAVGAYHSRTPAHNARYQQQIWKQLVDLGAVAGSAAAQPR